MPEDSVHRSASGDPVLLTPGPLTTSVAVKQAMQHDAGSRDPAFIEMNRRVRERLVGIAGGSERHLCVPVQGSGTFAVEAMLGSLLPRNGRLLNLVNGAYGRRISTICDYLGRERVELTFPEDRPVDPAQVAAALAADAGITHVALVHCETTSGIANPLTAVADVVRAAGRALLVDAMSSFGALPIDADVLGLAAVAASANKCLQGAPGLAFCIVDEAVLSAADGNAHSLCLDLQAQARAMAGNGQWRFTPPTHCVLALAEALDELQAEGGPPAREARYRNNCRVLVEGMRALGFRPVLEPALQAPIIVTFHQPRDPGWDFTRFYNALAARGFLIYPGKLTEAASFRVGCIGAIDATVITAFLDAVRAVLDELQIHDTGP